MSGSSSRAASMGPSSSGPHALGSCCSLGELKLEARDGYIATPHSATDAKVVESQRLEWARDGGYDGPEGQYINNRWMPWRESSATSPTRDLYRCGPT
ncbi:hypothetical protein H5410_014820 [Solanum commersonii]|uniref:Uncharacterized protein n=1 Tax=Solanum commersonii TaxID=4109 RepID=A0A9J5ZSK1_SOLCO|nr:hypothetical protein H5410_014820 [Solanum commersonii]